jgi:hypothetical protein
MHYQKFQLTRQSEPSDWRFELIRHHATYDTTCMQTNSSRRSNRQTDTLTTNVIPITFDPLLPFPSHCPQSSVGIPLDQILAEPPALAIPRTDAFQLLIVTHPFAHDRSSQPAGLEHQHSRPQRPLCQAERLDRCTIKERRTVCHRTLPLD